MKVGAGELIRQELSNIVQDQTPDTDHIVILVKVLTHEALNLRHLIAINPNIPVHAQIREQVFTGRLGRVRHTIEQLVLRERAPLANRARQVVVVATLLHEALDGRALVPTRRALNVQRPLVGHLLNYRVSKLSRI